MADTELVEPGEELQRWTAELPAVVTRADYDAVAARRKHIETYLEKAHAKFDPSCASTYKAWQDALVLRREFVQPAEEEDEELRKRQQAWVESEEARERLEAEQRRLVEFREAERRKLEDAVALSLVGESTGDVAAIATAEAMLDAPVAVAPVFVPSVVPKGRAVAGGQTKQGIEIVYTDTKATVLAIAAGYMSDVNKLRSSRPDADVQAVDAFLKQFTPVFEGIAMLSIAQGETRRRIERGGETFVLPGVTVKRGKRVI